MNQASKEPIGHYYSEMIPGVVNMLVEDENLKLRELIEAHQAQTIVRDIQKLYDDKLQEVQDLNGAIKVYRNDPKKTESAFLAHQHLINIVTYLD